MEHSLRIAVTGHRGTGRATLAQALTRHFNVDARRAEHGGPPADLIVHVLGARVRHCDEAFLATAGGPVVVVSGKADLRDGPERSTELAQTAARRLGHQVYPVSARWALAGDPAGGLAALADPIRACGESIARRRAERGRHALAVQAARGIDRDAAESALA